MDKIIPWLTLAAASGVAVGTYLLLWGREWARWRGQYVTIRRRPKER